MGGRARQSNPRSGKRELQEARQSPGVNDTAAAHGYARVPSAVRIEETLMRRWCRLSLVLALLSGCATPAGNKPPPGPPADEALPLKPCGRAAVPVGPAPRQVDTGGLEMAHGGRALFFIAE